MKWLPGAHHIILSEIQRTRDFVDLKVQEHKKNFDPSLPRDYIDCFLAEVGEVGSLRLLLLSVVSPFSALILNLDLRNFLVNRRKTQILVLKWQT